MINVLLQTTIEASSDDWSIDRFSYLRDFLSEVLDDEGKPSFTVTARNREKLGAPDSVLIKGKGGRYTSERNPSSNSTQLRRG